MDMKLCDLHVHIIARHVHLYDMHKHIIATDMKLYDVYGHIMATHVQLHDMHERIRTQCPFRRASDLKQGRGQLYHHLVTEAPGGQSAEQDCTVEPIGGDVLFEGPCVEADQPVSRW